MGAMYLTGNDGTAQCIYTPGTCNSRILRKIMHVSNRTFLWLFDLVSRMWFHLRLIPQGTFGQRSMSHYGHRILNANI